MDANYLYTLSNLEDEDYQNAGGDFWKGLFNKGGGGTGSGGTSGGSGTSGGGGGIDPKAATEAGILILGLAGGWLAQRKARKAQEERDRAYTPPYNPPPPKNNTAIYVIGGLAVVGIGVAIYLATKKK